MTTENETSSYVSFSTSAMTPAATTSGDNTSPWSTVDDTNSTSVSSTIESLLTNTTAVASTIESLLKNATQWYVTEAANITSNSTMLPLDDDDSGISIGGVANGVAGTIMSLVTFFGQVMVFIVVSRDARLRTPGNFYIISLAIADMSISIMSMPVWTVYSAAGYWPMSQGLCDLWNVIDYVFCTVSIYTILFISVDRYLSLRYPLSYSLLKTPSKAIKQLVAIWIFTACFCSCYIGLTQTYLGTDRDERECSTYYLTNVYATVILCTLIHWTGVGGTAIFYVLIYRIVRSSGRVERHYGAGPQTTPSTGPGPAVTRSSSMGSTTSVVSSGTVDIELSSASVNANPTAAQPGKPVRNGLDRKASVKKAASAGRGGDTSSEEKDRKALRTIALLLVTFAICWLPLSWVFVIEAFKPGYLSVNFIIGGYWLGYVNSMLNPVCYAVGNPYFRESLRKICCSR